MRRSIQLWLIIFSGMLLILLSGCGQTKPDDAITERSSGAELQYMPFQLTLDKQELKHLTVEGLTSGDRMADDADAQELVRDFFNRLEPVAVPVTKEEYEKAAFVCGYIGIEFETDDGVYAIRGDIASKILVRFSDGAASCYGIYSVTAEEFEAFAARLYGQSENAAEKSE